MSHFTVIVVGDNIEESLAPYQENNMGDCPEEYMEFCDQTDFVLEKWKSMKVSKGETVSYKKPVRQGIEALKDSLENKKPEYETIEETIPKDYRYELSDTYCVSYETFEIFVKEYFGYNIHEDGSIGYRHNPNSYWDWYQIGGRWAGFFKVKEGAEIERGGPSLLMINHEYKEGRGDSLLIKDLDFEAERKKKIESAEKAYDKAQLVLKERKHTIWKHYVKQVEDKLITIEQARKMYAEQPGIADWDKQSKNDNFFRSFFGPNPDDFLCTKEEYVETASKGVYAPYAFIWDGQWIAQGDMGWWGMSNDKMDNNDWAIQCDSFFKFLLKEEPESRITLVDCHI